MAIEVNAWDRCKTRLKALSVSQPEVPLGRPLRRHLAEMGDMVLLRFHLRSESWQSLFELKEVDDGD